MSAWHAIRGAAAGLAVVAAAAVATGCSSGTSSSSPTAAVTSGTPATSATSPTATATVPATTTPTTATPTATASASPSPTPSRTARAVSPSSTPSCQTSGLRASLGPAQGAAGSVYQNIIFTNATSQPCTLYGYPGVSLLGGTPVAQLGAAAQRSTQAAPTRVTLPAGGTANALLRVTQAENYPSSVCHPVTATTLKIYPPNQTVALLLPYKAVGCASTQVKLLTIGVVQAGSGG